MSVAHDYSHLLIKVCSEKAYIEDIRHGKIYMNESGYFRKLEDNYRGDKYDGKSPIDLSQLKHENIILGSPDEPEKNIVIPIVNVTDFTAGFEGDNKIPIFCCSLVSEEILEIESNGVLKFRKEYLNEMKQFGNYFCVFTLEELIEGMEQIGKERGFIVLGRKVRYTNIKKEYPIEILNDRNRGQYESFFKKDREYQWQNEWRILFHSNTKPIIDDDENHYTVQIPEFQWFIRGSMDDLEHVRLTLKRID